MKVLRILTRANGGGPVRHLGALERELAAMGVESRFVIGRVGSREIDAEAELRLAGARPERMASLRPTFSPSDVFAASRRLSRIIDEFEPDVVHTHTAVAGVAGRLAVPPGVAVVHTFHGHTLAGGYWSGWRRAVVRGVERWLARRTDVIVTVAERVAEELRAAGLAPRRGWRTIAPAPDPLPPGPTRRVARAGLEVEEDAELLLFAGRLEHVKGLDVLLRALAGASEGSRSAGAQLLVCGAGREEAKLRKQAESLAGRAKFLGWRSDLEVPMAAADLLVMPSRNEGWPIALVDAAAAGLPVVATDVGGCAEIVNASGHGLLVPPEDPGALANAIETLLAAPGDRAARATSGAEWAGSALKPENAAAAHLQLYESLVAERGA